MDSKRFVSEKGNESDVTVSSCNHIFSNREGVVASFHTSGANMNDSQLVLSDFPYYSPIITFAATDSREPVTYLKEAGVALITKPQTDLGGVKAFLGGFGRGYERYVGDGVSLSDADQLSKFAGQLCYMSFGDTRTMNKDASKYFSNIKEQKHGSVFEHPNFSFLFWGIDRAVSHELVRHRAGFGFSQVSQRYVDDKDLRFILNEEFDDNGPLYLNFIESCSNALRSYMTAVDHLSIKYSTDTTMNKRDIRKRVNQSARRFLPNCTETAIVVTMNARGLRHFCEMRASRHADLPINDLALKVYRIAKHVAPIIFEDYEEQLQPDGVHQEIVTPFVKV
jgi:thymidylate synthase (FAD)